MAQIQSNKQRIIHKKHLREYKDDSSNIRNAESNRDPVQKWFFTDKKTSVAEITDDFFFRDNQEVHDIVAPKKLSKHAQKRLARNKKRADRALEINNTGTTRNTTATMASQNITQHKPLKVTVPNRPSLTSTRPSMVDRNGEALV